LRSGYINNKKIDKKEKKKFLFLLMQNFANYLLVLESGIPYFLGCTIFTNAKVENIHRRIFIDARVRNIIGRP